MYFSTWQPIRLAFQRRRFANLMELYELNHQRLTRLVPGLARLADESVSTASAPGKPDLYLIVEYRHRFTTDIRLTHYFSECPVEGQGPDLAIRVYHDSAQAEVHGQQNLHLPMFQVVEGDPQPASGDLDQRWLANLFLERWLGFCLNEGYRFPDTDQPIDPQTLDIAL